MTRILKIAGLLTVLLLLANCGSPTTGGLPDDRSDNYVSPEVTREVSWAYNYYFLDTVNYSSPNRWTVENLSGKKLWAIAPFAYSGNYSWVIGRNYWNRENDVLTSQTFTVPADRQDNRLSFWARWQIADGDFGYVEGIDLGAGDVWTTYFTFTNGTNPDWPGWTKYTYELPDTAASDVQAKVRFRFSSNTAVTGWGFGVDSVSVYQRRLSPALNVIASDGTHQNKVDVDWTIQSDPLVPEGWYIYRSDVSETGPFDLLHTETNPAMNHHNDTTATPGTNYWYKVVAYKAGYPDSPDSNVDMGWATP